MKEHMQHVTQWVPGALYLGLKWPERVPYHSPPFENNGGTITPLPIRLHGIMLN
jgi:hypothetical protein